MIVKMVSKSRHFVKMESLAMKANHPWPHRWDIYDCADRKEEEGFEEDYSRRRKKNSTWLERVMVKMCRG